jgi:hypothetical protein
VKLFAAAGTLDINGWVRGLMSAAISGGASAISSGTLAPALAPEQFNVYDRKLYILICGTFCFSALVSVMKFLQTHPIPDERIVEKETVKTTIQPGTPTTVEHTMETTTTSGVPRA